MFDTIENEYTIYIYESADDLKSKTIRSRIIPQKDDVIKYTIQGITNTSVVLKRYLDLNYNSVSLIVKIVKKNA